MRIGIVGGLDRDGARLRELAKRAGHQVELHTGQMTHTASAGLKSLVERADVIVIVTDVNSHGAVQLTRRLAGLRGRPTTLRRRFGTTQLAALLDSCPEKPRRGPLGTHA